MNRPVVVPETTTEQPSPLLGGAILPRPQRPTPVTPDDDSTPKPQQQQRAVLPYATKNTHPPVKPYRKPSPYDDDKESEGAETIMCSCFPVPLRLPVKKCNHDVGNIVPAATSLAGAALAIGHASSWLGGAFAGIVGAGVGHALWLEQDTNTKLHLIQNDMNDIKNTFDDIENEMDELQSECEAFNKDMVEGFIQTNNAILAVWEQLGGHVGERELSDTVSGGGSDVDPIH